MNKRDIEKLETKRHHSHYVSNQQVIHKCLLTYYEEISQNMPFQWYVQNVYDSCSRKGFNIPLEEVETTVRYFLQWQDRKICPHCMGRWQ